MTQTLVDRLNEALPQTQCQRCNYPDCRAYAQAMAEENAPINQCPPGGAQGIERLAALTGRPVLPLNPANGIDGPLTVAVIDENWCIGCTLCLKPCPTDAIVGTHKRMHTVIERWCTGCELCVPVCPVDCISLEIVSGERTGWDAWTPEQARTAQTRYAAHQERLQRQTQEHKQHLISKAQAKLADLEAHTHPTPHQSAQHKRSTIEAALAKARARQSAR